MTANVEGRTIAKVRPMTKDELDANGWDDRWDGVVVLELDDGTRLFPSRDPEGNGPGAMFGSDDEGDFRLGVTS